MVNIIVYLEETESAEHLVIELLKMKLIATASVDVKNTQYEMHNGTLQKKTYNVVTMQTKSLLFREICVLIEMKYGMETRITSTPIVSANLKFEEQIRGETKAI